jgi:hypothetical protein
MVLCYERNEKRRDCRRMLNSNMTIEVAGAEVNASRRNWRQHPYDDPVVITSARLPPTKIWGDSTASIPGQDRPDPGQEQLHAAALLPGNAAGRSPRLGHLHRYAAVLEHHHIRKYDPPHPAPRPILRPDGSQSSRSAPLAARPVQHRTREMICQ